MARNFRGLTRDINNRRTTPNQMLFRVVDGYKGNGDQIIQANTHGKWCNVTFPDILKILDFIFNNEDEVYPEAEGKQGRWYLWGALCDLVCGHPIKDILEQYGDKGTGI